ncbi:MAG: hypothetical protein IPL97_00735 [Niastella sp.]|nr:hypothetical protein [Niastella sp.]
MIEYKKNTIKDAGSVFIVSESRWINLFVGIFLSILSLITVYYNNFNFNVGIEIYILYLFILPGAYFIYKAIVKKQIIVINKYGFFYHGKLLTNWQNFITARYDQEEKTWTIQDNFVLFIEYFKPGFPKSFISKIPLTNTQDKSEEEIIAAIRFFVTNYKS